MVKRGGISAWGLAGRLAAVAALCLAVKGLSAARIPEGLAEGVTALALSAELPGFASSRAVPDEASAAPVMEVIEPPETVPDEPPAAEPAELVGAAREIELSAPEAAPAPVVWSAEDIEIRNKTDYEIDAAALLAEPLPFDAEGAKVLIIHTHGSEAYTPRPGEEYAATDPYRTTDKTHNVVRVGDELERVLTERGVDVVHVREMFDYPSYNGSYSRAWKAIERELKKDGDIRVVIDLHRDALQDKNGNAYKTVADIGDEPSAQVMIIAGSDFSGLTHPDWRKNLAFAVKLQADMAARYPTLPRSLCVSQYRYNQNATTGSLIVEVGTNGNTLSEALTAVRAFGECLACVLAEKG